MKTIRNYVNSAEAGFARSLLQSIGIDAALADELAYTLEPPMVPWGIRLQVPDDDVQRALEALDSEAEFAPLPDDFEPPKLVAEEEDVTRQPRGETSRLSAFFQGVFWTFVSYCVLRVLAVVTLGKVEIDAGLVVFAHLCGGFVGLIVREIFRAGKQVVRDAYREGREDALKDRPD